MHASEELITAQALADALSLSVETVWRYTRQNRIPYIDLGNRQYRYSLSEVLTSLSGSQESNMKESKAEYQAESSAGQKKLTYQDYLELPEETGYRYEVLDGVLVKAPSPIVMHQRVLRNLLSILAAYFAQADPNGEVFLAPLDVTLGDYTVVQPDIFYIASGQEDLVLRERINGPPTLVVEILSPSTSRKDRLTKLRIYQEAGVPHYWLVNHEEKTLECLSLKDGVYAIVAGGMDEDVVELPSFPGLTVKLSTLWNK
jgi:Uma2 family endonuclease/predicted DNA-binding transcriptional regulator AlpA